MSDEIRIRTNLDLDGRKIAHAISKIKPGTHDISQRGRRERLLYAIANTAERAAFRLTERRRGNTA